MKLLFTYMLKLYFLLTHYVEVKKKHCVEAFIMTWCNFQLNIEYLRKCRISEFLWGRGGSGLFKYRLFYLQSYNRTAIKQYHLLPCASHKAKERTLVKTSQHQSPTNIALKLSESLNFNVIS